MSVKGVGKSYGYAVLSLEGLYDGKGCVEGCGRGWRAEGCVEG